MKVVARGGHLSSKFLVLGPGHCMPLPCRSMYPRVFPSLSPLSSSPLLFFVPSSAINVPEMLYQVHRDYQAHRARKYACRCCLMWRRVRGYGLAAVQECTEDLSPVLDLSRTVLLRHPCPNHQILHCLARSSSF